MVKYILLISFCLFSICPTNAATVATIGDKSVVINKSTSCAVKNWGSNQANSCGCCLTKDKLTTKNSPDENVRVCIKGKYCDLKTLAQWAPGETKPDEIMNVVLWSTVDTPTVTMNPDFVTKTGKLRPERVGDFLGSLKKDLRDLRDPLYKDFSKPKCLQAKDLGGGGANTAQLYLIKVNESCLSNAPAGPSSGTFTPKYILKETKKKSEEIRNLRQLHQSELKSIYDLASPKRSKDKIAITFDSLNIKYTFKNSNHYLSVLMIAPGSSLMNLSKDLAASIKKGDSAQEHKNSDRLYYTFYAFGKNLGELHRRFMDVTKDGKLLGNSVVHGDLHMENVFAFMTDIALKQLATGKEFTEKEIDEIIKNILISLIDNESFAKSLKEKRPVAVDLFVLYAFTVSQFKSQYGFPKEISLTKWHNVMLKPFLLGYMSNWPTNQRPQLIRELKSIYTNPLTIIKLLPSRFLFVNPLSYKAKLKDINRVFDEISKP